MSYTTVKALVIGGRSEDIEELRNSHGSAPVIWDPLCQRYLGTGPFSWSLDDTIDRLWPLWRDPALPEHQRAVLRMTYDYAYVSKKDFGRAAADIRKFLVDFPVNPQYVNHWPRIAEIFEGNPDVPAIGFEWTSCAEDLWRGGWDEDEEEYGLIDWTLPSDVYGAIDGLKLSGTDFTDCLQTKFEKLCY